MDYPFFCFTQNEAKIKVANILIEELLENREDKITFSLDWVQERYKELSGYYINEKEAEELCNKIVKEISYRLSKFNVEAIGSNLVCHSSIF